MRCVYLTPLCICASHYIFFKGRIFNLLNNIIGFNIISSATHKKATENNWPKCVVHELIQTGWDDFSGNTALLKRRTEDNSCSSWIFLICIGTLVTVWWKSNNIQKIFFANQSCLYLSHQYCKTVKRECTARLHPACTHLQVLENNHILNKHNIYCSEGK